MSLKKSGGVLLFAFHSVWCVMRGVWFRISSRHIVFILYLTLTSEGVQNAIPISFFFSKGGGHRMCLFLL